MQVHMPRPQVDLHTVVIIRTLLDMLDTVDVTNDLPPPSPNHQITYCSASQTKAYKNVKRREVHNYFR